MDDEHRPREQFTDEEAAFLRFVRFGELPARIQPTDLIESLETDPAPNLPEPTFEPYQWWRTGPA